MTTIFSPNSGFNPLVETPEEKEQFIAHIQFLNSLQIHAQGPFNQHIYDIVMAHLHLLDPDYRYHIQQMMMSWYNIQFDEFIMPE